MSEVKQITAWATSDGEVYATEEDARRHQARWHEEQAVWERLGVLGMAKGECVEGKIVATIGNVYRFGVGKECVSVRVGNDSVRIPLADFLANWQKAEARQ